MLICRIHFALRFCYDEALTCIPIVMSCTTHAIYMHPSVCILLQFARNFTITLIQGFRTHPFCNALAEVLDFETFWAAIFFYDARNLGWISSIRSSRSTKIRGDFAEILVVSCQWGLSDRNGDVFTCTSCICICITLNGTKTCILSWFSGTSQQDRDKGKATKEPHATKLLS